MDLTIALVQLDIAVGDPVKNLERMDGFVRQASMRGADLVVFPEDAVCGPLHGQVDFVAHAPEYLAHFQALAVEHAIDIVPGSWTVADSGLWYNQAHYITAHGVLAGTYRKINLWATEKPFITPGAQVSTFPTRFGKVGLIICWDISFPTLFAGMVAQGVELVLAPAFWSFTKPAKDLKDVVDDEIHLIDALCATRAFENNIHFAYCNAAGELRKPGGDAVLSGRSQLTHPLDKVVVKAEGNAEEMLIARVVSVSQLTTAPPLHS